jgi:hypothetical protein
VAPAVTIKFLRSAIHASDIRDDFSEGSAVTFVGDHLVEKQRILRDALDSGNTVLALSAPSKSGKTVFVEKVVGKDDRRRKEAEI